MMFTAPASLMMIVIYDCNAFIVQATVVDCFHSILNFSVRLIRSNYGGNLGKLMFCLFLHLLYCRDSQHNDTASGYKDSTQYNINEKAAFINLPNTHSVIFLSYCKAEFRYAERCYV